jgi:excisionase family DNA binding protein
MPSQASGPSGDSGRLLTAEQLAERWQVTAAHVYRLTREGAIPAVRLGRYRRYRLDLVRAYEESFDKAAA